MSYYLTTSIPYVNAAPHLGHALEFVQADAFARFHRLIGDDTYFLTGTDDNSLKNVLAAEREGRPVGELVERNANAFFDLTRSLGVTQNDFIRTSTDPRHLAGVRRFWEACDRNGDIYRRPYRGLYCVGCEQFYTADELIGGLCPEHGTPPEVVEEENYFFRLSRYTDRLIDLIDSGGLRVVPESRRNEVRAFLARGLDDISISRSSRRAHGWGIPVPGDPAQVVYVWFDALTNYITALGYAEDGPLFESYWLDNPRRVHAIGKGILRFHAVYWPAMLLSAALPLPTTLFVHGYLTVDGQKISKSLRNAVDPADLIQRVGLDAVRYWLLREVPPTGDIDYTAEKLDRRYHADLANGLGNLLNRTVSMVHRYRQGIVPPTGPTGETVDRDLQSIASAVSDRLGEAIERDLDPQSALVAIWDVVNRANRYVQETAPWTLAGAERTGDATAARRLDTVLASLAESLRIIAEALRPFLPDTSERIARQLGGPLGEDWRQSLTWSDRCAGRSVATPEPIFPRLEVARS